MLEVEYSRLLCRRVPHGTRGLKSEAAEAMNYMAMSRPAWDAWIEMGLTPYEWWESGSRPAWDAWIEIKVLVKHGARHLASRPAWDAWIEIKLMCAEHTMKSVASRMGRVD